MEQKTILNTPIKKKKRMTNIKARTESLCGLTTKCNFFVSH